MSNFLEVNEGGLRDKLLVGPQSTGQSNDSFLKTSGHLDTDHGSRSNRGAGDAKREESTGKVNPSALNSIMGMGIHEPDSFADILTPSQRKEQDLKTSGMKFIIPKPAICVKGKDVNSGMKIFINLCVSPDIPPPPKADHTDEELLYIMHGGEPEDVDELRFPMSIGELHSEKDKGGVICKTIDVIVNVGFFESKVIPSKIYSEFVIALSMDGIGNKYPQISLDKNHYKVLKNKKSFGKLNPQFIRGQKLPLVQEIQRETKKTVGGQGHSMNESMPTVPATRNMDEDELKYEILRISENEAEMTVELPLLKDPKTLEVKLGGDRIVVDTPLGSLDIFIPFKINQNESRSIYNSDKNQLVIKLKLET